MGITSIIGFYFFLNGKAMALSRLDYGHFARSEKIPLYVSCADLLKVRSFQREVRRELKGFTSVRIRCHRGGSLHKPGPAAANVVLRRR